MTPGRYSKRLMQAFTAQDARGTVFQLCKFEKQVVLEGKRGREVWVLGWSIETEEGDEVFRIAKGEYQILATETYLSTQDPDAP